MSNKLDDGGPVYPVALKAADGQQCGATGELWQHPGISLRDHLAGLILQGLLVNAPQGASGLACCKEAYQFADTMIAVRKMTTP